MDYSLIVGLVPSVVQLIQSLTGDRVTEEAVAEGLREIQARGLPHPNLDRETLEEIRAAVAPEPSE